MGTSVFDLFKQVVKETDSERTIWDKWLAETPWVIVRTPAFKSIFGPVPQRTQLMRLGNIMVWNLPGGGGQGQKVCINDVVFQFGRIEARHLAPEVQAKLEEIDRRIKELREERTALIKDSLFLGEGAEWAEIEKLGEQRLEISKRLAERRKDD